MNQKLIQNHDDAMNSHYFTYNKNEQNKKYPIKIDFFRISSKKFAQNQVIIKPNKTIDILEDETEENFNLSDDSIQNFINYVHLQDTFLNNNNIIGINYLAKKYEVNSLIKETEEYIHEHHQELILPLLLINQKESFERSSYEKVISNNLEEYVDNESLSEINISILYRILFEYHSKKEMNNKIIDFIFKCADKLGREASVLFSFIDINKIDSFHLNKLLTDYSKVIDFHFINSSLTLTLYEIQNQMIQQAKEKEKEYEEYKQNINKEISELKKEIIKMKDEMNDKLVNDQKILKEQHANEIKTIKSDIDKMNKILVNQMNEQKQSEEQNLTKIKNEIDGLKSIINQMKNENLQLQQQMLNLTAKSLISIHNDNRIFPIPHLYAEKIEPKYDTNQYFKNLLVWICKNYKDVKFGTWIGAVAPNSRGWMTLTIYDTRDVNSEGFPRYCGGCYQTCSTGLYTFSTHDFAFSFKHW